ncbi:unnamed protein product [Urochloa humidicola]
MDGKKRARAGDKKQQPAAAPAADADDATQLPAARKAPPADDGEPPVGIVEEVDDDDDEEQVERFYALLANIRAMRGMLPPYAPCAGDVAGSRKRLRAAEPPWRPAFRMEDFEAQPAAPLASSSNKTKLTTAAGSTEAGDDGGESASGGARPAVVVTPSLPPHAAVRPDSGSYKD